MLSCGHKYCAVTSSIISMSVFFGDTMSLERFALTTGVVSLASMITCTLADTDSDTSKISKKIPILKQLKSKTGIALCFIVAILSLAFYLNIVPFQLPINRDYLLNTATLMLVIAVARLIIRKIFAHRKGTHTIILNLAFYVGISTPLLYLYLRQAMFHNEFMFFVLLGLFIGLASHLLYDCCTVDGCPLLAPFYNKTISILPLRSGKDDWVLMVATSILSIALIFYKYPSVYDFITKGVI